MKSKLKTLKGFTLVETLIVIAIIGILAVVAYPTLFKYIELAKISDLESDINAVKKSLNIYRIEHSTYTTPEELWSEIQEEIENLSYQFRSEYTLDESDIDDSLELRINTREEIRPKGIEKLKRDLGDIVHTSEDNGCAEFSKTKANDTEYKTSIHITLNNIIYPSPLDPSKQYNCTYTGCNTPITNCKRNRSKLLCESHCKKSTSHSKCKKSNGNPKNKSITN